MNLDAFSKIASLVVAAAYVVLWMVLFGVRDQCLPRLLWFAFLCIIPSLALVWFPEAFGVLVQGMWSNEKRTLGLLFSLVGFSCWAFPYSEFGGFTRVPDPWSQITFRTEGARTRGADSDVEVF